MPVPDLSRSSPLCGGRDTQQQLLSGWLLPAGLVTHLAHCQENKKQKPFCPPPGQGGSELHKSCFQSQESQVMFARISEMPVEWPEPSGRAEGPATHG